MEDKKHDGGKLQYDLLHWPFIKEMMKVMHFGLKKYKKRDSWQEVQEITKKTAPDGTYTPPAGYSKKDKLDMMDIQRR